MSESRFARADESDPAVRRVLDGAFDDDGAPPFISSVYYRARRQASHCTTPTMTSKNGMGLLRGK